MGLQLTAICNSIAGLSVTGVTLRDLDEIPEAVDPADCPILFPEPDGFLSNIGVVPVSLSTGESRQADVTYNLRYTFLHSVAGEGAGLFDVFPDMIAKVVLILNEVLTNDTITGLQDFQVVEITNFGPVSDPAASRTFHGTQFVFSILEFLD